MSLIENLQLGRICLQLKADNKFQRKHALEEILKIIFEGEITFKASELQEIWETVHRQLVQILNDQAESCRNAALDIIKFFLTALPSADKHIIYVIPILTNRLGSQELIEFSEEVRLKSVALLTTIVPIYKDYLPAYFEDLVTILTRTIIDNYPNVKKESSLCISLLAKTIPRYFYSRSDNFVNPILNNFSHQHYKVRVISIKTIGDVLLYGNSKSMEEVAVPLSQKLFDQSAAVRAAVVEVAGCWLVKLNDRYSWWHKLVPLILTGLHDEIEETREKAAELWDKAGLQYMQENETDEKFKDKINFLTQNLEHYPSNLRRPNLGCRVIVQQNLCKLVAAIENELEDWLIDIRIRSAQLLCVLILNVEQNVIQHIEKLLPSMYRACNDKDKRVVENVQRAAEFIGYFVPPDIYCELVLPSFEENVTTGHLRVLGSILNGSNRKSLVPHLNTLGKSLEQKHVCQSRKIDYQRQMLFCCESILKVCQEDCIVISKDLFKVIFTVLSITTETVIQNEAKQLLEKLVEIEGLENLNQLFVRQIDTILIDLKNDCEFWNIYTPEFHIFRGCILHARSAIGHFLNLVQPILIKTMNETADAEVRLKQLILLSEYLQYQQDQVLIYCKEKDYTDFIDLMLKDVIVPGLLWSAGRTAEAIRTASVCCLCALLQKLFNDSNLKNGNLLCYDKETTNQPQKLCITDIHFSDVFEKIIPILISLLDDNSRKTRLYSLEAASLVIAIGNLLQYVTEEHIHRIYPVILKRLDDGCDEVRYAAANALKKMWSAMPKNYDLYFCSSHVDTIYTSVIVHLDDPEEKFQELMLEVLIELGKVHPELLLKKIENCRGNFRNQNIIDKLLIYVHKNLSSK